MKQKKLKKESLDNIKLIQKPVKYIIHYDNPLLQKVRKFTDSGKLEWNCVSRWWILNHIFYDLIKKDLRPILFKITGYGKKLAACEFGTEIGPILMQKASEFGLSTYVRYQTGRPSDKVYLEITAICVQNYDEMIRDLEESKKRLQKNQPHFDKAKHNKTEKMLREETNKINIKIKKYEKERKELRKLNLSSIWWRI